MESLSLVIHTQLEGMAQDLVEEGTPTAEVFDALADPVIDAVHHHGIPAVLKMFGLAGMFDADAPLSIVTVSAAPGNVQAALYLPAGMFFVMPTGEAKAFANAVRAACAELREAYGTDAEPDDLDPDDDE